MESSGNVLKAMENALFSSARSSQQSWAPDLICSISHSFACSSSSSRTRCTAKPWRIVPTFIGFASLSGFHHQMDNLFVGLLHADSHQLSHSGDGVLHALFHDAVAAEELVAALKHGKSQQSRIH